MSSHDKPTVDLTHSRETTGRPDGPWASCAEPTDEELVDWYKRIGSQETLEALVKRHLRGVRSLVANMVLDEAVSDDLCQEVFLRALRGLAEFRGQAKFSTWLYRLALNVVYDYLARHKRTPVRYCGRLRESAERASSPDEAAMHSELESAVTEAVAALSPKLRAAIVLVCLEGRTVAEAATIEGCSRATMHWRMFHARRLLKRRLRMYL